MNRLHSLLAANTRSYVDVAAELKIRTGALTQAEADIAALRHVIVSHLRMEKNSLIGIYGEQFGQYVARYTKVESMQSGPLKPFLEETLRLKLPPPAAKVDISEVNNLEPTTVVQYPTNILAL